MNRFSASLALLACGISACGPDVSGLEEVGTVEVVFDLTAAANAGFNVDAALITLVHRESQETITHDLIISEGSASLELSLRPGGWDISVELFDGETLAGTGTGRATVLRGFLTAVVIEIEIETGGVILTVEWSQEFHGVIADISKNPIKVQLEGLGVYRVHGLSRIGWDIEVIESPTTGGRTHKDPGLVTFPDVVMLNLTSSQNEAEALVNWMTTGDQPIGAQMIVRGLGGETARFTLFDVVPVDGDPTIFQEANDFTVAGVRLGGISTIELADYQFFDIPCAAPGHIVEIDGIASRPCYPEGVLEVPADSTSDPLYLPALRNGNEHFAWAVDVRREAQELGCVGCGNTQRKAMSVITLDAEGQEISRISMFETWAPSFTLFSPHGNYRRSYLFDMTLVTDLVLAQ